MTFFGFERDEFDWTLIMEVSKYSSFGTSAAKREQKLVAGLEIRDCPFSVHQQAFTSLH